MKIIYKQSDRNSLFSKHNIRDCCFKLQYTDNDIKRISKKPHSHMNFEIHIINKGHMLYEIANKEYTIKGGNMLIIPPGVTHCFKSATNGISKCAVVFSFEDSQSISIKNECVLTTIPIAIQNNIQEIFSEYKNNLFFSQQLLENSIFNIVIHILRLMGYKEDFIKENDIGEDYRILIAKQYVNDNLELNLSVSDVAASCYLSTKQLTRLFKKHENITPAEYIRIKKTEYAEQLINEGFSLAEISEKLSFSSQYHFNSFFKKYSGMTPGEYRSSMRQ